MLCGCPLCVFFTNIISTEVLEDALGQWMTCWDILCVICLDSLFFSLKSPLTNRTFKHFSIGFPSWKQKSLRSLGLLLICPGTYLYGDLFHITPAFERKSTCIFTGRTDAEAEAPILWPPDVKGHLFGKDPDAGKVKSKEVGGRRWDGWIASPTQWTWIWANSRREWTEEPGILQSMGSQRVRYDLANNNNCLWNRALDSQLHSLFQILVLITLLCSIDSLAEMLPSTEVI